MKVRFLPFLMLPILGMAQVNSNGEIPLGGNTSSEKQPLEIKRNAQYNLEEIKVRWKKAALENCPGVPCVVTPPAPSFTCGTSTISDVDGNVYETVSIGTQCWTKKNLRVTRYNDNSPIDLDASGGANGFPSSENWSTRTSGAYTIYANQLSTGTNATNYGFLYNWFAAAGIITNMGSPTKNICPTGWHVPTDGEWTIMIQTLDPSQLVNSGNISTYNGPQSALAGGEMKSTSTLWDIASSPSPGTNTSGFSALPGGQRTSNGGFGLKGSFTLFWSTTELNPPNAWYRTLQNTNPEVTRANGDKLAGASIRCLKD